MSRKPKHRKSRRPNYKNKARQTAGAQPSQAAAVMPAAAVPTTAKATPAAKNAPISTAATTAQYPFFTSELKRIGIISGIIFIILIVAAVILT